MLARFNELRALGIVLSIDDFGTGYANFGHFMNFPLDQLKIDPAFVHGLPASVESAAIARAIVSMGSSLGVRVMAVGVENRHQADFLRSIWCEYAQGSRGRCPPPSSGLGQQLGCRRECRSEKSTGLMIANRGAARCARADPAPSRPYQRGAAF
jgi:EAL domain-containing protein (putative c-di-GMP-specific phosphodiesterase class I)